MSNITRDHIVSLSQKYTPEIIKSIQQLIKVPAVADVDTLEPIINATTKIAQSLGQNTRVITDDGSHQVGIFVGDNFDSTEGLLVTTGLSTVALDEGTKAKYDPFTPVLEGNSLYGSGAWKNKGNVVLSLYAKKILSDLGHGDLIKMVYSDETSALSYKALRVALNQGLRGKAHIVSCPITFDQSGRAMIYTGCRGYLRYKVTVSKKNPDDLPEMWTKRSSDNNPIDLLMKYWNQIQTIFGENPPHPSYPEGTRNDQYVFSIHSGAGDSIPATAHAIINIRSVVGFSTKEYMIEARNIANSLTKTLPFEFEFEIIEDVPAAEVGIIPLARTYKEELERTFKYDCSFVHDFYTDGIYYTQSRGWSVGFMPTLTGKNQNSFDEYLDIDSIGSYLTAFVTTVLKDVELIQ